MPLFLTSDVLVEILSESDLRVLPASDPGNGNPYLLPDGTLRVDSGSPTLPGPTVEAGKFWMTDGLGGTVYGEPALLDGAAVVSALGYTPVNKAGDTMTGALVVPQLRAHDAFGNPNAVLYPGPAGYGDWCIGNSLSDPAVRLGDGAGNGHITILDSGSIGFAATATANGTRDTQWKRVSANVSKFVGSDGTTLGTIQAKSFYKDGIGTIYNTEWLNGRDAYSDFSIIPNNAQFHFSPPAAGATTFSMSFNGDFWSAGGWRIGGTYESRQSHIKSTAAGTVGVYQADGTTLGTLRVDRLDVGSGYWRWSGGYPELYSGTAGLTITTSLQSTVMGGSYWTFNTGGRAVLDLRNDYATASATIKGGIGQTYHTAFTNSADAVVASISPTGAATFSGQITQQTSGVLNTITSVNSTSTTWMPLRIGASTLTIANGGSNDKLSVFDLDGNLTTAGAVTARGLTTQDDATTFGLTIGRYSPSFTYSYMSPSATSSGLVMLNAALNNNVLVALNRGAVIVNSGATVVDDGVSALQVAGAVTARGLTTQDDATTFGLTIGRYSPSFTYSYMSPSATSSGLVMLNAALNNNVLVALNRGAVIVNSGATVVDDGVSALQVAGAATFSGDVILGGPSTGLRLNPSGVSQGLVYWDSSENRLYSTNAHPWVVMSDAGFKVRNQAGSADAPLTAGAATFSGNVTLTGTTPALTITQSGSDPTYSLVNVTAGGNNILSASVAGFGGLRSTLGFGRNVTLLVPQTGYSTLTAPTGLLLSTGGIGLTIDTHFVSGYNVATQIGDNTYGMKVGASGTGPMTAGNMVFGAYSNSPSISRYGGTGGMDIEGGVSVDNLIRIGYYHANPVVIGDYIDWGGQLRVRPQTDRPAIVAHAYNGTSNAFEVWNSSNVTVASISKTGAATFSGNVAANSGLVTVTGTTSSKVFLANASYTGQLAVENSVGVSLGRLSGKGIALFNSCSPISIDSSGNITYPDGNSSLGESGWRWGGVWTTTLNASGAATFSGAVNITSTAQSKITATTTGYSPALWVSDQNSTLGGAMYFEWRGAGTNEKVKAFIADSTGLGFYRMTDGGGSFLQSTPDLLITHAGLAKFRIAPTCPTATKLYTEKFGEGATTDDYGTAFGYNAIGAANSAAFGYGAVTSYESTAIGRSAVARWRGVAVGFAAGTTSFYGVGDGVAIGQYASSGHYQSIALGGYTATTAANQLAAGAATVPINNVRLHGNAGAISFERDGGTVMSWDSSANVTFLTNLQQGYASATPSARHRMIASGQRVSEIGNGAGTWQSGYREEYNVAGIRTGFYGVTPVAQSTGWAAANYTPTKTIDPTTSTMADLINLVATLTQRLIDVGVISA